MKYILLLLLLICPNLNAIELQIPQEATGKYDLRINAESENDRYAGYDLVFWNRINGKSIGKADILGGYASASMLAETMQVVWHPSGDYVAFTGRATKHSVELYIYSLENEKPTKLDFLDYIQNALGRIDAVSVGLHCISKPLNWTKDDLEISLYFSVDRLESGRHFYESRIILHLDHGQNQSPRIELVSVSNPKDLSVEEPDK